MPKGLAKQMCATDYLHAWPGKAVLFGPAEQVGIGEDSGLFSEKLN